MMQDTNIVPLRAAATILQDVALIQEVTLNFHSGGPSLKSLFLGNFRIYSRNIWQKFLVEKSAARPAVSPGISPGK